MTNELPAHIVIWSCNIKLTLHALMGSVKNSIMHMGGGSEI